MSVQLDGQVALITGAGRGQGRAHARLLAEHGADVAICDFDEQYASVPYDMTAGRSLTETARLVEQTGRECLHRSVDVRDPAALTELAAETVARFGRIDILVANAGVWAPKPLHETGDELWRTTIDTNLSGVFHAIRAVAPHMIDREYGRIVATSSAAGRQGTRNLGAYSASKFGVIGLVKTAAIELGEHNITVNAVCPSFVDTPMINFPEYHRMFRPDLAEPSRETSDEVVRQFHHTMPVGTYPAEEISKSVLFLVSGLADMVSGSVLDVTAGKATQWGA
jgi:SDR family mycofactocin-dependent oxidoreductase